MRQAPSERRLHLPRSSVPGGHLALPILQYARTCGHLWPPRRCHTSPSTPVLPDATPDLARRLQHVAWPSSRILLARSAMWTPRRLPDEMVNVGGHDPLSPPSARIRAATSIRAASLQAPSPRHQQGRTKSAAASRVRARGPLQDFLDLACRRCCMHGWRSVYRADSRVLLTAPPAPCTQQSRPVGRATNVEPNVFSVT